jgi:hypothetical protein
MSAIGRFEALASRRAMASTSSLRPAESAPLLFLSIALTPVTFLLPEPEAGTSFPVKRQPAVRSIPPVAAALGVRDIVCQRARKFQLVAQGRVRFAPDLRHSDFQPLDTSVSALPALDNRLQFSNIPDQSRIIDASTAHEKNTAEKVPPPHAWRASGSRSALHVSLSTRYSGMGVGGPH